MKPVNRMPRDARENVGEPSPRIRAVHLAVTMRLYMVATRWPPRSEPQNSHASRTHPASTPGMRMGLARHSGSSRFGLLGHLPIPREQVGDSVDGVIWKSGKHVSEPGLRINVVHLAGLDHTPTDTPSWPFPTQAPTSAGSFHRQKPARLA